MDLKRERGALRAARFGGRRDDRLQAAGAVEQVERSAPAEREGHWQPGEEAGMVGKPRAQWMPVMQVEVQRPAEQSEASDEVQDGAQRGAHGGLDVVDQLR